MKQKISLSKFSTILTVVVYGMLFMGCIATVHDQYPFFILLAFYLVLLFAGIFYGAAYIKVNPEYIFMGSLCKSRKISVRDIERVELFQPTLGAIRIFASGGFMGYWGLFRESDIGRYYGFYGKASDCFLVKMKNGDKYVLGCDNPQKIIDYIESQKSIMEVTR